tara:strand:- start:86 stop:550 length:465 start_codon:yes stop_codon:yes gene_type:complete
MATKIDGETYLGETLVQSISTSGDVTMYLWPLRCLNNKTGGPTFGVDVNNVEVIRFDTHGQEGHWHAKGYDKLGPGKSHIDFPEGIDAVEQQLEWSLKHIREEIPHLLEDAGYHEEAKLIDPEMLHIATYALKEHLEKEGDLRPQAIAEGALSA